MDERYRQALLYDFYGELLNDHQKTVFSASIFDDMSYSELAEEFGCTRQAAFDLVRRINRKLEDYENKLGLVQRFMTAKEDNQKVELLIRSLSDDISKSNIDDKLKKNLTGQLDKIKESSHEIFDNF